MPQEPVTRGAWVESVRDICGYVCCMFGAYKPIDVHTTVTACLFSCIDIRYVYIHIYMISTCASLYRLHTSPHQAFQCDAMLQLLPRLSCPGRLLDRFTVRSPVSLLDQGSNTGIEAEMRRIRNKLNKQPISLVHFQNHDLPKSSTIFRVEFSMLTISMAMTKFGSSDSSMSSGIQ